LSQRRLSYLLLLSIAAAVVTVGLKAIAYRLTGSIGLLSDALESLVNLVAAAAAYGSLLYAARPVDASHTYGHEKIEYFSSGLEGGLILVAALAIGYSAVWRLVSPQRLEPLGVGLLLSLLAALINGGVGVLLLRAGKRHNSIILEADGKHLLTDVWTSAGVLAALALVIGTGWEWLDPVVALLVAANILWTGGDLMQRSFNGLMDRALPEKELAGVRAAIQGHLGPGMAYHALRTRQAGARSFVDFHLLVPGSSTVRDAHDLSERIEESLRAASPGVEVTIHIEPIEEQRSWQDSALLPVEQAAGQGAPGPAPQP
jgi:cation diffusion facilitator family transporter